MANALSPKMTVRDFENGYWYREQLMDFAERIGIPAATELRKDELEKAPSWYSCARATLRCPRSVHCAGRVSRTLNVAADFLAADNKATRAQIIAAWNELKKLDVPKDYASWVKTRTKRKAKRR
jgi:SAP domain-containing new25